MRVALVAMGLILSTAALADAPAPSSQSAQSALQDDASLRSSAPASIANRGGPERRRCREQAARLHLFGLGRHKFLLRCRAARRAGTDTTPPR